MGHVTPLYLKAANPKYLGFHQTLLSLPLVRHLWERDSSSFCYMLYCLGLLILPLLLRHCLDLQFYLLPWMLNQFYCRKIFEVLWPPSSEWPISLKLLILVCLVPVCASEMAFFIVFSGMIFPWQQSPLLYPMIRILMKVSSWCLFSLSHAWCLHKLPLLWEEDLEEVSLFCLYQRIHQSLLKIDTTNSAVWFSCRL